MLHNFIFHFCLFPGNFHVWPFHKKNKFVSTRLLVRRCRWRWGKPSSSTKLPPFNVVAIVWVVWTISCCYPDYHFMNLIGHRDREIIANLYSFCADIYLSCLLLQIISWPKEVIRKLFGLDPARNFRTPPFFLSQLISSHFCCCVCVCVDKSFFFPHLVNKNLDQHSAIVWLENPAKV